MSNTDTDTILVLVQEFHCWMANGKEYEYAGGHLPKLEVMSTHTDFIRPDKVDMQLCS